VGCDTLIAERLADLVASQEPIVVAPVLTYTLTPIARLHPGGISLPPEMLVEHLQAICDELARNGFRKIVLAHAHGGNVPMHQMILWTTIDRAKQYSLYSIPPLAGTSEVIGKLKESQEWGHACEIETSLALHLFRNSATWAVPGQTLSAAARPGCRPGFDPGGLGGALPEYCVGEPAKASAEKGRQIMAAWVDTVVDVVRKVKKTGGGGRHGRFAPEQ